MKKIKIIIISITILIIFFILILISNSHKIALYQSGYSTYLTRIIEYGLDNNQNEFEVVTMENDKNIAIGYLTKNDFGFWKMEYKVETSLKSNQTLSTSWNKTVGFNSYDTSKMIFQWSKIYYGNNATSRIQIDPNQIPQGIAYYIEQSNKDYTIRLVTYEAPGEYTDFDISSLIKDYIKTDN